LRSAHKDLESKLKKAEQKQKLAEDQLTEKSSEFERLKTDLQAKRDINLDIIKKLQKEVKSLRTYMSQAEAGWDLLNSDVFGKHPDPKLCQFHGFPLNFILILRTLQILLDMMKSTANSFHVTILSSWPETIAGI
jgi:hypothetical protein